MKRPARARTFASCSRSRYDKRVDCTARRPRGFYTPACNFSSTRIHSLAFRSEGAIGQALVALLSEELWQAVAR